MEEQIKLVWSPRASDMLEDIHEYISEYSLKAAYKYIDGIYNSVAKLEKYPESCSPCKNSKLNAEGFRCCLYRNHIIVYEFIQNQVEILAVIYSKIDPDRMIDLIG